MVSAFDNYLLSCWVLLHMLGLSAKPEKQHWKFKQLLQLDQGLSLNNDRNPDRNKRHEGSNGNSSIWDPVFGRRKRQKGSKVKSITWDRAYEYRPRVGADSTETLFALALCPLFGNCSADCKHTVGIYSPREKCGYTLPPIPGHPTGIPLHCQCVSLDGILYLMGGNYSERFYFGSQEVYSMDLKGHGECLRKWEQKASMHNPRVNFGIGVMEGKIYVFGGISWSYPFCACEMYDPKENVWSQIKPMPSARHGHNVFAMGKELFVHGGEVLHPPVVNAAEARLSHSDGSSTEDNAEDGLIDHGSSGEDAQEELIDLDGSSDEGLVAWSDGTSLEIYNPEKDEWRMVENWLRDVGAVFKANGSIYAMGEFDISRLDTPPDTANWVHFTRCPFIGSGSYLFGLADDATVHPFAIEAPDGTRSTGLVGLTELCNVDTGRSGQAILQTEVFSSRSTVEWKIMAYHSELLTTGMTTKPFFCRIVF